MGLNLGMTIFLVDKRSEEQRSSGSVREDKV